MNTNQPDPIPTTKIDPSAAIADALLGRVHYCVTMKGSDLAQAIENYERFISACRQRIQVFGTR